MRVLRSIRAVRLPGLLPLLWALSLLCLAPSYAAPKPPAEPAKTLNIPLDLNDSGWLIQPYRKIKPSRYLQLSDGIKIEVRHSASPLIYVLDQPLNVAGFSVRGALSALPKLKPGLPQGEAQNDDYALSIGLVTAGKKRLSRLQSLVAPRWLKQLHELAPQGQGIGKVIFYQIANEHIQSTKLSWGNGGIFRSQQIHTLSGPGSFDIDYHLDQELPLIALWISSDGDNSKSDFDLILNNITLN